MSIPTTAGTAAPVTTNTNTTTTTTKTAPTAPTSWRDRIKVHPLADRFPLMSETDPAALQALADDIRKHELQVPAVITEGEDGEPLLCDGRNRLDALELLGMEIAPLDPAIFEWRRSDYFDPIAFIVSANIHRRHLTAEQRIELAEELAKANPTMSARRLAKLANISPTTA